MCGFSFVLLSGVHFHEETPLKTWLLNGLIALLLALAVFVLFFPFQHGQTLTATGLNLRFGALAVAIAGLATLRLRR